MRHGRISPNTGMKISFPLSSLINDLRFLIQPQISAQQPSHLLWMKLGETDAMQKKTSY